MRQLKFSSLLAISIALTALVCAPLSHSVESAVAVDEHARTEAAVWAVEEHWLRAEATGDTTYLRDFFLAQYRSVNADGTAHSGDAIIANAAKYLGSTTRLEEIHQYQQAHPSTKSLVLLEDLAIVSFNDPKLGQQQGVKSVDILVYRNGGWHAVYSQHSNLTI
jgi:hypothetical protein